MNRIPTLVVMTVMLVILSHTEAGLGPIRGHIATHIARIAGSWSRLKTALLSSFLSVCLISAAPTTSGEAGEGGGC